MKQAGNTQWQRKPQALFALILYRIAHGIVDIEYFASILQQIYGNRVKNAHIDSSIFTGPLAHVDLAKLVKKKRFKRKSEDLLYAYKQYVKQTNQSGDNTSLTVEDVVNGWADLTRQDKAEFMSKVHPKITTLIVEKDNTDSSGAKQYPENDQTEAAFKLMEDLFLILLEETPPDKKDALVAQMKDAIAKISLEPDLRLPDEIFSFGSTLLISDVVTKMDNAFSINPAAKELLLQPLYGALVEMEAKKFDWESGVPADNSVKLQTELKEKDLFFNKRTQSRALKKLARRNILLNIDSALDGTLMNDLEKTILEQRTNQQTKTQSVWVCEPISPEAETEAEKKVLELLFRRRNENDRPDRNY